MEQILADFVLNVIQNHFFKTILGIDHSFTAESGNWDIPYSDN